MTISPLIFTVLSVAVLFPFTAAAAEPTALIEDVSRPGIDVEAFDQVAPDRVIRLLPDTKIVISYLKTCVRESITGGTVTIGTEQSAVIGGKVQRTQLDCPGSAKLRREQAGQAGAAVFRAPPRPAAPKQPEMSIYGTSPVLQLSRGGGRLTIERVDRIDAVLDVLVDSAHMRRGTFYDLAARGVSLAPGGLYRISYGTAPAQLVRVDPEAQPGRGPIVPRLLRF